jgi:sulfopropanediol 3-dehydrogenase
MIRRLKDSLSQDEMRADQDGVEATVRDILANVQARGDIAVREYSERFDKWSPQSFRLTEDEIASIVDGVPQQVIDDILFAQDQVRSFAQAQRASMTDIEVETLPGVFLGHRHVPVMAAGAYVPGGRYPLTASAHMTIVTAKVAGVPRVVACTPPIRADPRCHRRSHVPGRCG